MRERAEVMKDKRACNHCMIKFTSVLMRQPETRVVSSDMASVLRSLEPDSDSSDDDIVKS